MAWRDGSSRARWRQASPRCRFPGVAEEDETADLVDCSTGACRACATNALADLVAVCCCCPCALVSLVALACVKLPWVVGRRCFRTVKRIGSPNILRISLSNNINNNNNNNNRKAAGDIHQLEEEEEEEEEYQEEEEEPAKREKIEGGRGGSEGILGIWRLGGDEEEEEADKVWLQIYQVGSWPGFGRISLTAGLPPAAGD